MASKENQEALDSVVSLVAELTNTPLSYIKVSSEAQTLQKAIDRLEQTEKALDKACEELEDIATNDWCCGCKHSKNYKCEITKGNEYECCKKEQWKEYLLSEVSND